MSESADYVVSACRENDVKFIRLWFTDIVGALKSFAITVEELEKALDEGMGFDGSSIEGFARIDESDMIARPDPATFQLVPWRPRESGVARMFCDIYHPGGEPFEGDPRYVLKRQLKRAADLGYTFYVSPAATSTRFPMPAATFAGRRSSRWKRWASKSSTATTKWPPASTKSRCGTPTR